VNRVEIKPAILEWACERSRVDRAALDGRFPQLDDWIRGERQPTFNQAETFARATHTPFGFLFLPEPPVEPLPIQDFRTLGHGVAAPSADLLDTI